ncbi:MAG: hypothetical protein FWG66_08230 [Spirochaetes bacterium]|nr:hypothetical protein [Spirochaetota bacterium]
MPRAAMLGNAAGLSLTLIAMAPMAQMWGLPYIGIVGLGIAVLGFFGKRKFPFGLPPLLNRLAPRLLLPAVLTIPLLLARATPQ